MVEGPATRVYRGEAAPDSLYTSNDINAQAHSEPGWKPGEYDDHVHDEEALRRSSDAFQAIMGEDERVLEP